VWFGLLEQFFVLIINDEGVTWRRIMAPTSERALIHAEQLWKCIVLEVTDERPAMVEIDGC
jgi:hypothetical protein